MELGALQNEIVRLPQILNGHPFWVNVRKEIRKWIMEAGPKDKLLPTDHPLIVQTMVVDNHAPYVAGELRALKDRERWSAYQNALSWLLGVIEHKPTVTRFHHIFHIWRWEGFNDIRIKDLVFKVELGGGSDKRVL